MPIVSIPDNIRAKLFEATDQTGDHWNYPGTGKLKFNGRMFRARQLWWALLIGDGTYPRRMDQTCDHPGCVNPAHWYDALADEKPLCPAEKEIKFHRAHGFFYVATALTGGQQWNLGKDRAAALNLWREGRAQLAAGLPWHPKQQDQTAATIGRLATAFRLHLDDRYRESAVTREHRDSMRGVCDRMVAQFGRTTLVANLGPKQFSAASEKIKIDKRNGRLRAWGGYKSEISKIRHVFTWGVDQGHLIAKPRFGDSFPIPQQAYERIANRSRRTDGALKVKTPPPKTFTAAEIRRMLEVAPIDIHAWILLGLNCALENKEISLVRTNDIRRSRGGEWWIGEPRIKTAGRRLAHLWDQTAEALLDAIKARPEPAKPELANRIFLNDRGYPVRADGSNTKFCERFRKVMKDADCYIGRRGFRALRHTFRTNATPNPPDQEACEYIMGHRMFGSTMAPESPTYVESVARDRLRRISNHLQTWLYNDDCEKSDDDFVGSMADFVN
jgi:integrase